MCREMQYDEFALELISEKFFQADLVNGIPLPYVTHRSSLLDCSPQIIAPIF